jgi:hypothetical protein
MNEWESMAKITILIGGSLVLIGLVLWAFSKLDFLGNLPGDLRIEGRGFTCLIPLASSILLSLLLTLILNIIVRLLNR